MKEEFKKQMRDLFKTAWNLIKNHSCTKSEALHKAWELLKLRKSLRKGVVSFIFKKVDGSVRRALGTLNLGSSNKESDTEHKRNESIFTYFDLQKDAFRCFKIENFIGVEY